MLEIISLIQRFDYKEHFFSLSAATHDGVLLFLEHRHLPLILRRAFPSGRPNYCQHG